MSSSIDSLPPSPFNPAHYNSTIQWLLDVKDIYKFYDKVKRNELEQLPPAELRLVIAFAERQRILHEGCDCEPRFDAVLTLIRLGVSVYPLDSKGRSILAVTRDLNFYKTLKHLHAVYVNPEMSELQYFCMRIWVHQHPDILKEASIKDFLELKPNDRSYIFHWAKENPEIRQIVLNVIKTMELTDPNLAVQFLLCDFSNERNLDGIKFVLGLIQEGTLSPKVIEGLMTDYIHLVRMSDVDVELIRKRGPYSLQMHVALSLKTDLKTNLWCLALLRADTIPKIGKLLSIAHHFVKGHNSVDFSFRKSILLHILAVEAEDSTCFWAGLQGYGVHPELLNALETLGLHTTHIDSKGRGFLFYLKPLGWVNELLQQKPEAFEIDRRDIDGNNALDFWVQDPLADIEVDKRFLHCRRLFGNLVEAGLSLSQHHPYFKLSQEAFPDDPYMQALYAYYLKFRIPLSSGHDYCEARHAILNAMANRRTPKS